MTKIFVNNIIKIVEDALLECSAKDAYPLCEKRIYVPRSKKYRRNEYGKKAVGRS